MRLRLIVGQLSEALREIMLPCYMYGHSPQLVDITLQEATATLKLHNGSSCGPTLAQMKILHDKSKLRLDSCVC